MKILHPAGNQKGVALIFILWVVVILGIIAGEFCHSMRNEVRTAGFLKDETMAYYIAYSGIHKTLYHLFNVKEKPAATNIGEDIPANPWRVNTDIPPQSFGDGAFKIEIGNESGKINLNYADAGLLKILVGHFEADEHQVNVIVDSIQDWRDKDSLYRINGAENEYYRSLPEPYDCKNGEFTSVNELLYVRGVTSELFHKGLKDLVSVVILEKEVKNKDYGKRELVNVNAASPELLSIFPDMTPEIIGKIIAFRKDKDISGRGGLMQITGPEVAAGLQKYIDYKGNRFYTIEATGSTREHSTVQKIRIMAEKISGPLSKGKKGYSITQWIDSIPDN